MTRIRERGVAWSIAVLTAASLAVGGCSTSPTAPAEQLSPELTEALDQAIQDEFRAENTYLRVLTDFGDVAPFKNIVYAEERHSEAIATLFIRRELAVPLSTWDVNSVARFASLTEACAAGADAEIENIDMYDVLLKLSLPADVRTVFENNRAASLNRHLPAFQACS